MSVARSVCLQLVRYKLIVSRDGEGKGGGETGTNYRGVAVRKGAPGPTVAYTFFFSSVVSLFVDCTI